MNNMENSIMEIKDWGGGLTRHEVAAIEKIKQAFADKKQKKPLKDFRELRSVFPWKGYSGFRFVDAKERKEGEFDLVIVTHCNVLVVELKHWNGESISNNGLEWYKGRQSMGYSPVEVTRKKTFLLKRKLEKFCGKFGNSTEKYPVPKVEFLIVMTGNSDFNGLSDKEKMHVISLNDFLELADNQKFLGRFGEYTKYPENRTLNKNFSVFDEVFGGGAVKPKSINSGGYYAEDNPMFLHPRHIYREYLAKPENSRHQDQALLRRWDFTKISHPEAQTPDGRYRLVSREYDILNHIKLQNRELYHDCLNYKSMPQKGEIAAEHIDLFEMFPQQKRFNQFVWGYNGENLSIERRFGLVQLLLSKFAKLHKIGIAHRDLGEHSIWLSADDKITLSGFATAYFLSEQTVGDIREILEVSGDLAKTAYPLSSDIRLTPYQYDVRSLAVLAWHIIKAERISPISIDNMKTRLVEETEWYGDLLKTALSDDLFENAMEFSDRFDQVKPNESVDFSFDFTKLEPFTRDINHSRSYREDGELIVEDSEKEVYRSGGQLVKAWLNANPRQDQQKARMVLNWLENMAKLASLAPDYIPKIYEFGIAQKSGSLFVVSEFVENGLTWKENYEKNDLSDKQKMQLIGKLISSIEHFHGLGFVHGDLKPDHVLLTGSDDLRLYLVDVLNFHENGQSRFNTEYSPEFDHATERQRDNFAVMKMACELLNMGWNTSSEKFPEISKVIHLECSDSKTAFISLARFKEALGPRTIAPKINITVGRCEQFSPIVIYPDNGELFVRFEKSKQGDVLVQFIGFGGVLRTFYSVQEKRFTHALKPIERTHISKNDRDSSVLSLSFGLDITHASCSELKALNDALENNESFGQSINQFIAEHISEQSEEEIAVEADVLGTGLVDVEVSGHIASQRPNIQKLWQAILDTETEALPSITASEALQETENGEIYIPYDGEINPIDQFKRDEIVEAIGKSEDGEKTFKYGDVDISKSRLNELHLKNKNVSPSAKRIKADTPVYLQSKQNKASYMRRKNALQRILDGESAIKNLVDYFDENCTLVADSYDIKVSDEQFARYDQPEKNVSLNEAQCMAFQRLISNGPLSLLQGPPGTGKTEFIAAFVHYLFDVRNVRNILLVSQSHEAVNTAAERIRKHCQRLGTDLYLVRFSNREVADSEILEDVFSSNLVGQKRRQLDVNKINNVCQLGRSMGLPEIYLRERAELEFDVGVQIRRYQKIVESSKDDTIDEDEKHLLKKLEHGIRKQAKVIGMNELVEIDEIMPKLIDELNRRHNIQPAEDMQAGKLIDLTQDMLDALSNDRTNYDEFLARSRQLVIGTCVGIGQKHIGIADNLYDWVIVDEAARSISSELAIAMQSGTRILLVGDHKQLPPLYSEEHKNALARRLGISKRGEELDHTLGSDFERVFLSEYGKKTCATLKTQYRMAPAIGSLVSACFYENVLENGKQDGDVPDIYGRLPDEMKSCVTWLDTTSLPNAYHEQGKSGSLFNRAEADVIMKLLQDLAKDETFINSEIIQQCLDKNEQAIGVICMYGEQKKLIRRKFNECSWDDRFLRLVKIDSVDSYQGKENRVIILSLTRHDKKFSTGFLHLPNRINVALSRAMDKLVIVGAKNVWEQPKNSKTPLAKVLQFMQKQGNAQYAVRVLKNAGMKK